MQAAKTPHRNESLSALARVNDQVCFVLFLDSHVGPEFQRLALDRPTDFTPTVFPDNAFAERIYVPVERLPKFRAEQVVTVLGVSFAFAVEQLILYIETVIRHWSVVNGVSSQVTEPIDDCLKNSVTKIAKHAIEPNLIKTIKYLRLRRNHVIHASSVLTSELVKTLKYDGPALQKFWQSKTTISEIDFSSDTVRMFTANETISLIKLARICVEEIDNFVAKELDAERILRLLDRELLTHRPELKARSPVVAGKRIRKIKKRALELYALRATPTEVAHVLRISI
jgi:hypothetical protein